MTIGYYINDRFVLDGGESAGVNVMLFNGDNLNYWFDEKRFSTTEEAISFIENYDDDMVEVKVEHPIANRRYSAEEMASFGMTKEEIENL